MYKEVREMDFVSVVDPKPLQFDLSTDENVADRSHFEFVFSYAFILYSELSEECLDEIEVEKMRQQAKNTVTLVLITLGP